jgi:hypothetical protein
MNSELERICKAAVLALLGYCPNICQEGIRKATSTSLVHYHETSLLVTLLKFGLKF